MALFTVVGGALTIGLGAASITTGITGLFATVSALALNTLVGIGINLAVSALAGQQAPSFAVQGQLQAGDDVSRSILLGYSATAGSLVYANTWGKSGKSKNAYLTQVICVSDWRVTGLAGLIVNGAKCTLLPDDPEPNLGIPVQEYRTGGNDYLWVKFYDGTQTVADPLLVNTVSTADRPYSDKRVGYGCAYAIVTARVNDKLFTGFPTFKFVVNGAPLYDISKDSTKGGDGPHRYDDPSTWGGDGDHFPAVQLYNLTRGFYYGDSWFYGMQQVTAARLPSASWITEIAKCRAPITVGGVPEPTYRTGGELPVNAELGNAVKAILTGCNGRLSEIAGSYDLKLGAPAAPSFSFSDGDIISTEPQSFTPFFGLAETVTGVTGKYPNPADGWNAKACPPIYRADLEAKAGGRRLLADVPFDLVPYPAQAQRLLQAALEEAQRERRHTLVLPPQYWAKAVPGATCEWTVSERNGYVTKLFRVDGAVDRANLDVLVDITEVDPSDYDPGEFIPPPDVPTGPIVVPPQALPSFNAVPYTVQDSGGKARRPAIMVSFAGDLDDVSAVQVEVRRAGSTDIIYNYNIPYGDVGADGSTRERILNGTFLPATNYEVRGTLVPISAREVTASDWIAVTTPNVGVGVDDLDPGKPAVPTGLALASVADPADPGYSKVTATWAANPGAQQVAYYDLEFKIGTGNFVSFPVSTLLREFRVTSGTAVQARIRAVNALGRASDFSAIVPHVAAADTVAPAIPAGLTATGGFEVHWLKWTPNTEPDLARYEIYQHTAATPAPVAGTPATFPSGGNQFVINGLAANVTRFYWVRAVDISGNKSAWAGPVSATSTSVDLPDITPPTLGVPGVPTLTSAIATDPSGGQVVTVTVTFAAGLNAVAYGVGVIEGGGSEIVHTAGASPYAFRARAGVAYSVRVQSIGALGNRSTFSAAAPITPAGDTVAPATPSGLSAAGGFRVIWVSWASNTESDLRYYEVYEHTAATPVPVVGTAPTYIVLGTTMPRQNLSAGNSRWFWVRAVDTSGNKSAWAGPVTATATVASPVDLAGSIDLTSFAVGLTPIEVRASLPATGNFQGRMVLLTTDNKVYRHAGSPSDATGFSKAVDGADIIANSITAGSIAAGAIGADQLAVNAVRAKHLLVTDWTNLHGDGYFADGTSGSWTMLPAGKTFVTGGTGYNGKTTYLDVTGANSALQAVTFDVAMGRTYLVEGVANRFSATAGICRVSVQWLNEAGAAVAVSQLDFTTADALDTWVRKTVAFTVPAGAVKGRVVVNNAGTTISGGSYHVGYAAVTRMGDGELIVDGAITAAKLTSGEVITLAAQIKDAIITSAKILSLDAGKITTGTLDAARIAANSISADKVNISGASTLADWRQGGDTTRIAGGAISANTIDANKLRIGSRNLTLEGIIFEHNSPSANRVSWSAGAIRYIDDSGNTVSASISAWPTGSLWTSGVIYIYWTQGAAALVVTTNAAVAFAANNVVLATYQGGTMLDADFGKTIIDGSDIKTGTVTANQIAANTIRARNLYISDLTNLAADPYLGDVGSWASASALKVFVVDPGNGYAGRNTYMETTGAQSGLNGDYIDVAPGQEFILEAIANRYSATSGSFRVYAQWANDALVSQGFVVIANWTTADALNTWVRKTATGTVPATATKVRIIIDNATTTIAGGTYRLGYVALNRRSGAELIVDGSISAAKLSTGELITLAAQIKDAIITSAKIVSLDAAKIQAGTIMSGEVIIGGRAIGDIAAIDTVLDDMTRDRVKVTGAGTGVYTSGAADTPTGTRSFRSNDDGGAYWMPSNIMIPFDTSKLYKVTFKVRRTATANGGNLFMGVRAFAADQVTPVQPDGASGVGGHFVVASPVAQTSVPLTFTDYVGWIKGSAAAGTHNGTIAAPAKIHSSARYITPYFVANNAAAAGAGSVMVFDSIKIETIDENGAALINAGTVKITPGQIEISGATTLADWRQGGDATKIAGGAISTNTIDANKLTIGMRNIKVEGLQFEHNSPSNNRVSWTAGTIRYYDNSGTLVSAAISANATGALWSSGTLYVFWTQGGTTLQTTFTAATAFAANNVVLAAYRGGTDLAVDIGRTIIDGSSIKTGTITADRLNVTSLSAIAANVGTLTAGILQSADGKFVINLNTGSLKIFV